MANRIDKTYFEGDRSLPNLNDKSPVATLQLSIDKFEPKFFKYVFGFEFQALMLANPTEPIYKTILDGVVFRDVNGVQHEWEGVNESIANYVYFYHVRGNYVNYSGAGYNIGDNDNSNMFLPQQEPRRVYNQMPDALDILYKYLTVNSANYPTLIFKNFKRDTIFGQL